MSILTFTRRQGVAGASETIQVTTLSDTGKYVPLLSKYDGTEALSCVLWPGDDQAVTTTLPATWDATSAPLGQVDVAFPLDAMTSLEVTWYDGMLRLADGSADLAAFRLEVTPGPGTATAGKVYHAYKDLLDELPYVGKLKDQLNDQSGFREVAADSRRWVDAAILRAVPSLEYGLTSMPIQADWSRASIAYDPYGSLGLGDDPIIAAALDADQLVLTTSTGRRIVKAAVYKTLSVILRRAVGTNATNDLTALSTDYEKLAEKTLATCVAHIDVNADGIPEYVFSLAPRAKLRRA